MTKYRWLWCWLLMMATFGGLLFGIGKERTFGCWMVTITQPEYPDACGVTSALEHHATGNDPMVGNPLDPWARKFNYPRLWLVLSGLGIDRSHTAGLGCLVTCLFFLGLLIFPRADLAWPGIGVLLPAVFSPATLLGIERGNVDLLVFFLVALGIAGWAGKAAWGRVFGVASLLSGFLLKLYPVFALVLLVSEPRARILRYAAMLAGLVACYVLLTWSDLVLIYQGTPKSIGISYGMNVLWMQLARHGRVLGEAAHVMAWCGVVVACVLAWLGSRSGGSVDAGDDPDGRSLAAFRAGAGIYAGTFLLGNNWDYRLIFLIFTLPMLVRLLVANDRWLRRIAAGLLVAIMVSFWHIDIFLLCKDIPCGGVAVELMDEGANWLVFLGLSYVLGRTLPVWLRGEWKMGWLGL